MSTLLDKLHALQARAPRGMVLGLDRVEDALHALGDPQRELACVHIAGSNGKGSTAAMVASAARAAGLHTGLYTSPHLCRFAERIQLDGAPLDDDAFDRALGAVLERCRPDLTFFESLTAAAFFAFREARVDVAVLEVGLGGRLDATNVIARPIAAAITTISLEHTAILGETLEAIAREKAGIWKRGAPAVLGPLPDEAERAAREVAAEVGASEVVRAAPSALPLGLAGAHQAENAGVAVELLRHVAARFPDRDWAGAVPHGLREARWAGRMETIAVGPVTVLLDAAHNPDGMERLARSLDTDPARTTLVFGALADKRWPEMLARIAPFARRRIYTEPKGRAPAPLAAMAEIAPGAAVAAPRAAVRAALAGAAPGELVVVTGSIYLVGEVRAEILGIDADPVIAL
jgi:dihydrofolate synthase/folylpolyglutamate synthase